MPAPERIEEEAKRLLELAEKATPGPWEVYDRVADGDSPGPDHEELCYIESKGDAKADWVAEDIHRNADADFIAAARELAPALADAYLAQQKDELATARIAAAGMALAEAVLARMVLFKNDPHRAYLETLAENVYAAVEARKRSRAAVSIGSPETRRDDGWPLCPVCGEDELGDLANEKADPNGRLFCYRCGRVTLVGGSPETRETEE